MKRRFGCRRLRFEVLEGRLPLAFDPTGLEQEFLQLVNRMRTDPQGELGRLVSQLNPIASHSPEINAQLRYWMVDGSVLAQQWQALVAAPPLAWNEQLWTAASGHNQEMIRHRQQSHQLPGEPDPGQRMINAGYPARGWGESVATRCTSVFECHAAFAIDWGPPGPNGQPAPPGIQSPPAHRELLVRARYREIGIAVVQHPPADATDVGPIVVTKDFGQRDNIGNSWVVGAVFHDANSTGWYDSGEGRGGVTVKFVGPAGTFETTSLTAGGYQLQLPRGTYSATATGGGLRETLHAAQVVVGDDNVWLNFRQEAVALPGDRWEPNNDFASATVLGVGDSRLEGASIHLPDNRDLYRWTAPADGQLTARITFSQSAGNLALKLYDSAAVEVAVSDAGGDAEQITRAVTAGSVWYLEVTGVQRAVNPAYTLEVDGPGGAVPLAVDDKTATNKDVPVVIDILANDADADGDLRPATVQISQPPLHGTLSVHPSTGVVTFTPTAGYLGPDRFRYLVRDATNFASREASVVVAVVDYQGFPWQNPLLAADADGSGSVVPQDALVIINRLNLTGAGPLDRQPAGANSPPPYVDTSGDHFLSPIDVLRVVNHLNRFPAGEGESVETADGLMVLDPAGFDFRKGPAPAVRGGRLPLARDVSPPIDDDRGGVDVGPAAGFPGAPAVRHRGVARGCAAVDAALGEWDPWAGDFPGLPLSTEGSLPAAWRSAS